MKSDDIRYIFKYLFLILSGVLYSLLALVPMDDNRFSLYLFWAIGLLVAGLVFWYYYRETKIEFFRKLLGWAFIFVVAGAITWLLLH